MKIFKELKKLGYKHYTENTIEELDNLPLDSEKRIMEQSLVLRWFREKYKVHSKIEIQDVELDWYFYEILEVKNGRYNNDLHEDMNFKSYEEAELACLRKLIEICRKLK